LGFRAARDRAAVGRSLAPDVYTAASLAVHGWAPQVEGELAKAEAKFRESLGVKPDYVDAFQMLADLSMQRAKLAARFHAPLPR